MTITADSLRDLLVREAGCSMEEDMGAIEEFVEQQDYDSPSFQSRRAFGLVYDYQCWVRERADRKAGETW